MEKRKHVVILAAGDFPTHSIPLQALRDADYIVCCDSAYCQLSIANCQLSTPFVVVGDGDSLPADLKRSLGARWVHVDEQNYNDLHKAMSWIASNYQLSTINYQLSILGATGKREDHTLGNISYLVTFAEEYPGVEIEMLTDYGRFTAFQGSRTFPSFPRQQVSVFSMDPDSTLFSYGLKWPLNGLKSCRWWQATLNEALADSFELSSEGWVIVFQTY